MKAILRSINNFSCKLKQSNNLKYNISPKTSNHKLKSVNGNDNVVVDDAIKKDLKDYKIYGNTYQNSTKGINIYNVRDNKNISSGYTIDNEDYITNTYDNSSATGSEHYENLWNNINSLLKPSTNYIIVCEIKSVSGSGILYPYTKHTTSCINTQHSSYNFSNLSAGQKILIPVTTKSEFTSSMYYDLRTLTRYNAGQSGSITFRLSLLTDTTVTSDTFKYEPFTNGASPNTDYPQEIISCGDRTRNLFDKTNATYKNGYYKNNDGVEQTTQNSGYLTSYIPVQPNATYTIQGKLKNTNSPSHAYAVYYYDNSKQWISKTVVTDNPPYTFTTPNDCYFMQFQYRQNVYNENTVQIEEGSTATSYESYGYKIPVNVRSDNLYNVRNRNSAPPTGATLEEDYIVFDYYNTESSRKEIIYSTRNLDVKPSTTYLCVAEIEEVSGTGTFRPITRWASQNAGQFNYDEAGFPFSGLSAGQKIMFTATTYSNLSVKTGGLRTIALYQPGENGRLKVRLSILEDITITQSDFEYQPYYNETTNIYLDEPLRKLGEYSDYIDFKNGKVVRNINRIVLDGSEYWDKISGTTNSFYHTARIGTYDNNKKWLISDYYIPVERTNIDNTKNYITMNSDGNIRINNINITTANDFKTWLSENNTTVDYILPTPTEEDIELPNINLVEGKNIITIGTEIQGVFEVEYYSKEIIDISDYKYNLRKVED